MVNDIKVPTLIRVSKKLNTIFESVSFKKQTSQTNVTKNKYDAGDKENINPNMMTEIASGIYSNNKVADPGIFKKKENIDRKSSPRVIKVEEVIKRKDLGKHHYSKYGMNGSRRLENPKHVRNDIQHQLNKSKIITTKNDIGNLNNSSVEGSLNVNRLKKNLDDIIYMKKDMIKVSDKGDYNGQQNQKNSNIVAAATTTTTNLIGTYQEIKQKDEDSKSFGNLNLLKKYLKEYTYRSNSSKNRYGTTNNHNYHNKSLQNNANRDADRVGSSKNNAQLQTNNSNIGYHVKKKY